MIDKTKIIWRKPNYKGEWGRVSDEEIDKMCEEGCESGDIKIEKTQYGRKIRFAVYRVEKVGEMVEGLETLSRQRLLEELKQKLKSEGKWQKNLIYPRK